MDPSLVPAIVVGALVFGLGVVVLVALAVDHPDPSEAAVAYEEAWDRLDFDTLWRLSAEELRDGRGRDEFAAAKSALYQERADLAGLVAGVDVEAVIARGRIARAQTRLRLRDGTEFHNDLRMRRDANRWAVTSYRLGAPGRLPAR